MRGLGSKGRSEEYSRHVEESGWATSGDRCGCQVSGGRCGVATRRVVECSGTSGSCRLFGRECSVVSSRACRCAEAEGACRVVDIAARAAGATPGGRHLDSTATLLTGANPKHGDHWTASGILIEVQVGLVRTPTE